jgi:phosphatidylserine/phosphatidylglycerophosphate/cardiolipin synthase-like enzyme
VRPGFRFRDGRILKQPAIVVKVRRKKPPHELSPAEVIPSELDGAPVDVAPASPLEQLRASAEAEPGLLAAAVPPSEDDIADLALPDWDRAVPPEEEPDLGPGLLAESHLQDYVPPPDLELNEVKDAMRVTCHVSPDAGWPVLRSFLSGVDQNLTIAMYNFTAPHILDTLVASMERTDGELRLNLDGNASKYKDLTEDDVRDALREALGSRFDFTWAGVYRKLKTKGGYFPSAYHIKVAVRDRKAFWLSSGNWEPSNQDDVDPLADDGASTSLLRKRNREWHVIVEHPKLASVYDDYIRYDIEQARPLQAGADEGPEEEDATLHLPELLVADEESLLAPPARRFFPPKTFTFTQEQPLRIQPLLTPDNYGRHVLRLIRGARRRIYFQNQSFGIAKTNPRLYTQIWQALLEKSQSIEVRIIVRDYMGDARDKIEALVNQHFDPAILKSQVQCHTKGLVIDSEVVVVGSHNWTGQGVVLNRDASLIMWNKDIAKYFEEIFEHDWENLAKHEVVGESDMPVLADSEDGGLLGAATATGTAVPWLAVYQD